MMERNADTNPDAEQSIGEIAEFIGAHC